MFLAHKRQIDVRSLAPIKHCSTLYIIIDKISWFITLTAVCNGNILLVVRQGGLGLSINEQLRMKRGRGWKEQDR